MRREYINYGLRGEPGLNRTGDGSTYLVDDVADLNLGLLLCPGESLPKVITDATSLLEAG